jgi:hypothetical protein
MADEMVGVVQELSSLVLRLTKESEAEKERVETLQEIEKHRQMLDTLIARIGRS